MKFWEAMKALDEGKRVREKDWGVGAYWSFKSSGSIYATITDIFVLSSTEWELYEEPEKTLAFAEVVKGLKEGKIFKRKSWPSKINPICMGELSHSVVCDGLFIIEDFEANDWVEVKK